MAATLAPDVAEGREPAPARATLPGAPAGQRGGTGGRVLVLNASYEPINVCTVRRATVLLLKERAELLEAGTWSLHAESLTLPRPVVIRLVSYVRVPVTPTGARSPAARSSRATAGPASTAGASAAS